MAVPYFCKYFVLEGVRVLLQHGGRLVSNFSSVFESTTEVSLREGTDGYCYGSLEMDSNFIQNREFWEGAGGS